VGRARSRSNGTRPTPSLYSSFSAWPGRLALLLIRIIETTTGGTWPGIRRHLDRLQAGTFTGPAGTFRQRTELTKAQTDLLAQLAIPASKQIIDLQPAPPGPPSPAAERPEA
jgi:hypothetical protein